MTVQHGTGLARVNNVPDHRMPQASSVGWSPWRSLSSSLLLSGFVAVVEVGLIVAKAVDLLDVVEDGGLVVRLILGPVVGLRVGGDVDDLFALSNFLVFGSVQEKKMCQGRLCPQVKKNFSLFFFTFILGSSLGLFVMCR